MKVLKLGWEFPPFFAGGAGIVCNELTKALNEKNVEVLFVMPHGPEKEINEINQRNSMLKILTTDMYDTEKIRIETVETLLHAYIGWEEYKEKYDFIKSTKKQKNPYGKNLAEEIERFSQLILKIVENEDFDVIHAHDWVTFLAGINLKKKTGKPLIVHVHITEFDKSGGMYADPFIYGIEKAGMDQADRIIAVSNLVKDRCIHNYYQDPSKIRVIHNAATPMKELKEEIYEIKGNDKIVLFAGRITLQKGPEYFVEAARLVLQHRQDVKFIVAGTGDLLPEVIKDVESKNMREKFIFTGFYTRNEAEKIFGMADVFVMPSVSEPFGVVPYEAQMKKTPCIISKQSGISEVLNHALKVDFWDTRELANKMLGLLDYEDLHKEIKDKGYDEAKNASWDKPATKCIEVYREVAK